MTFTRLTLATTYIVLALASQGASAQTTDTLKKVAASGFITMGVRDASGVMSYTLGVGDYTGFHVDICKKIVTDLQAQLGLKTLDIRYQLVTPQNRITLVQNGTVDLECGSTTNNATRQKDVAFAPTVYVEEVRVAVKAKSGITSLAQLANKTVSATGGSTAVQLIRKHGRSAGVDFKELYGKDNNEGFLLLESGRADAFVADGQILATVISQSKQPADYMLLKEVISVEPIAIMIPKGDTAFKRAVDGSVLRMAKSGEIAALYDKWFVQAIPPRNIRVNLPASDMTKAAWAAPNDKPVEEYAPK